MSALVYNTYGARVFTAQNVTHQRIHQTKVNLHSKSEVERLIIEDCARRIVLLKSTTDRHEASHGLSATAGLLAHVKTPLLITHT